MLRQQFEAQFKVSDLYSIQHGAFVTNKDEHVDYEAATAYLDKTGRTRMLDRKEPFDETIFEPTEDQKSLKSSAITCSSNWIGWKSKAMRS